MTADSEPFGQTSELNKEQESTDGGRTSKVIGVLHCRNLYRAYILQECIMHF